MLKDMLIGMKTKEKSCEFVGRGQYELFTLPKSFCLNTMHYWTGRILMRRIYASIVVAV